MNGKPKLLIVDDDHDILDLLEVILFKDYEIVTAVNGFEGLKKAQEVVPDLILTDIMMPVMDGIMLLNNLRKSAATAGIRAVAITSFTEIHSVRSLLGLGFADVIAKPFNKDDMLKALTTALSQSRPSAPSA